MEIQCTPTFSDLVLKPTVNEKPTLLPNPLCPNHFRQRQHATSQSQLRLYYPSSAVEGPRYLFDPFAVFRDYVDHPNAIQMPRVPSLLAPVRCKSDGAGILKRRGSRHLSMSTSGYRRQDSDDSSSVWSDC
ncbi:uncharacterized protein LACBIDRAFT_306748 [Laccaria bicolor S238N-H82]|uniref:Predicted protein n=1 Tax=Laccaria bicolor (strain S238N-H82 / ATCC MYA-4686) TaxID=486041 RepID=B0DNL3_LACBS|nr:uncharacterized protein LACBIDRAFT_306748 [Laccaria bicolor S238N-H82]EDR03677.1 predicted protein [Laccaria bicolor S238N-H82]|eukprot:XP_001885530.1 predicted protein [Laccaria bicolor S238N-H82]